MEHKWLERLVEGNCLPEKDLFLLCERVKDILLEENNVNPVNAPVVICGDVHGQFYDLLNLFKTGGSVSETNYVFMGDFVDRGYNSVETVQLLMAYKAAYPDKITLLRGNHESRAVTKVYGFYDECVQKYGNPNPWKYTTDVFDFLPLAAIVDDRVLCIHGGLSPDIRTIDQIRTIDRNMEIPHDGAFSDLMWSDPADIETWEISPRGAGWLFGSRVVEEFNHINGLDLICRAHQLVQDGYRYWYPMKNLVTVWSAPNYCYRCGNMASILKLNEDLERNFAFFEDAPESKRSTHFRNIVPYFL